LTLSWHCCKKVCSSYSSSICLGRNFINCLAYLFGAMIELLKRYLKKLKHPCSKIMKTTHISSTVNCVLKMLKMSQRFMEIGPI